MLHVKWLHRGPIISSPNPFLDQLWRSNVRFQRSLAEVHTMESLLSTAESPKAPKTASKLYAQARSGPKRSKKKNHQYFHFGGHLLDRLCSFSLAFFPPPFTAVKETWQPLLPVYTSQKQAKKSPRGVRTMAFKHA